MKQARQLRAELDRWASWWKATEAFLDRIAGARDEDLPHQRVMEALLTVAAAAEQHRVARTGEGLLPPDLRGTAALAAAERVTRLPGVDEVEIAVAGVPADEDGDVAGHVWFPDPVEVFDAVIDGVVTTVRVPSYGMSGPGRLADLADDDVGELFGPKRRRLAALAGLIDGVDPSDGDGPGDEDPLPWTALTAARRALGGALPPATELPRLDEATVDAIRELARVARGAFVAGYDARSEARALSARVTAARDGLAAALAPIVAPTTGALAVLEDEGHASVADARAFADAAGGPLDALGALAGALDALGDALASHSTAPAEAAAVVDALDAARATSGHELLTKPVEQCALGAALDEVVDVRIAYPDGTLRPLRALELAFRGQWLRQLRVFRRRLRRFLDPRWTAFRLGFTARLASYVRGSGTTFDVHGLTLAADTTVGAERLVTASAMPPPEAIEPGQIAVLGGERPAAALVLGARTDAAGKLAVLIAPLRVSVIGGAGLPGRPGVVAQGTALGTTGPGLDADALRTGEHPDGAASDGLVEGAIAIWSRLCLLYGRATVDADLGPQAPGDPADAPLEGIGWYGTIDPAARTLILRGLGAPFVVRAAGETLPRVARAGELLVVRGTSEDGTEHTGVAEVDAVVVFRGSQIGALTGGGCAELSTTPLTGETGEPCALRDLCRPDEDLVMLTLRTLDLPEALVSGITLRRDFAGFDAPSLAAGTLLPASVVEDLGAAVPGPAGVDRSAEFAVAVRTLAAWIRFAAPMGVG